MAEQLASVPEENTIGSTAPDPVCNSYRESIRSVRVIPPEWLIRSTPFSQSGQSGSNYSSDSEWSATVRYTQHMVQAFGSGGSQGRALNNWFIELDVDWVLEIHGGHGLRRQLQLLLQDTSASWRQELVERWIRALTIIVVSIKKELVAAVHHETSAVALFGKASISAMLIFVEAILDVVLKDNVQTVLHMYICVSSEAQSIFKDISSSLDREGDRLIVSMVDRMWDMMILIDGDDTWGIEVPRGGGEVHRKTRVFMDCIVLMRKPQALTQNSARSRKKENLRRLIDETIGYMKDMLLTKSKLCSDPSLRYLFLLNNSYFVAQVSEPSIPLDVELGSRQHTGLELPPECEKYMNIYLDVSWGHVSSCIPKSNFHGPLQRWKNTSSLAKFESAFHKTYQAQKFWKVPEPQLRDVLRKTITERVISGYRDYLKEHPELAEHVSRGSSSPEVLEQMLGELFEG